MNLYSSIKKIHPDFNDKDFIIKDSGEGVIIHWYNNDIPQPTQAELESAWVEVEKELEEQQEKELKAQVIQEKFGAEDKFDAVVKQINIIANVLNELTEETPNMEVIADAKITFRAIKNILTK